MTKTDKQTFQIISEQLLQDAPIEVCFARNTKDYTVNPTGQVTIHSEPECFLLIHDLAHMVEVNEDRVLLTNFGISSSFTKQPTKLGPLLRELRTFAYQINICLDLGILLDTTELFTKHGVKGISDFPDFKFTPGETRKEKMAWLEEIFVHYQQTCTAQNFRLRLASRIELLNENKARIQNQGMNEVRAA